MSDDYDKNRAFGKPENIEKRLAMWAQQFSTDKRFPWVGLGLIDDLKCASRMLGGDPDKKYPDMRSKGPAVPGPAHAMDAPTKVVIDPKPEPAKAVEYDL